MFETCGDLGAGIGGPALNWHPCINQQHSKSDEPGPHPHQPLLHSGRPGRNSLRFLGLSHSGLLPGVFKKYGKPQDPHRN